MSFLTGILDIGRSAVKFLSGNSIGASLAKTALLGLAVRKLSQNALKNNDTGTEANIDNGVRLQAKPNSAAKIPVLYGSAFFGGNITDATLTNANKTMWYCLVLAEKTGTVYSTSSSSAYTLNNVYWNNQRIIFNADGITANYTVDSTGVIDRNISGLVRVYFYAGGRTAGQVPSGYAGTVPNAETLFPNWTSGTHAMSNLVFALVRVDYNREKGVTGIGDMLFNVSNTLLYPGDVLYDYLTNATYGAGIAAADILTADISSLNTYSQDSVAYDSPTGVATLADRYQINGLIDTDKPVLENAEKILSAAASWLSYDSHEGKWGVVINKTASSVASFTDSNIIGNISLSGTGLQDLYNQTKVEFPHRELRDSADFYNISVPTSSVPADWTPFSLNANEETNILNLTYDIINEPIQAQMLGLIELKQSRLDKVIQFKTDFTYYNLKAGDIISVTNSRFGFSSELFRIITINEIQDNDGALMMEITALQYNTNVYSIADLYRFTRTTADGIVSFGSIGTPGTPVVTKFEIDSRPRTEISTTAPTGVVEGIEFWLTTDTAIGDDASRSYVLVGVKKPVGGGVFTSGTSVVLEYVPNPGNFYVKTRGFNTTTVGSYSTPSGLVEFAPTQTTDALDPNTSLFDSTGGLLGALALFELLSKLSDLFPSAGSSGKSIFERIFEVFQDETGVDLVGQAAGGSLVVSSNLITKADGTNLTTNTASLDFLDPIIASGSSNVEVKLINGSANKDILAWDSALSKWRPISGCIDCEFPVIPEPPTPAVPCSLTISSTLPASNFSTTSNVCVSTTTVPYTGSYFIKFAINPGSALGGAPNPAINLVNPLARGTGSFKLYGTDGTLIESLSINSCIIHNDVVELPYKARAPGQDYYIIWEEGIVTNCTCENAEVNNATTWTFTTSEIPVTAYTVAQISPTAIASDGETNDQTDFATQRSRLTYTQSPQGTVCSTNQKLILDFSTEVIKGSGNVTIKERETGTTIATVSVAGATINTATWAVDFGTISGLQEGKYYDVIAPEGLLVTPSVVGSNTVCDKTTAVPAPPQRRSQAKEWGFVTQEALRVLRVEYCPADSTTTGGSTTEGSAKKRTNIKIVFNKPIGIKATAPAEITINEGIFGTFQKIDLKGTYATKKYGDIYDIGGDTLVVNPTKMLKGATSYYITIPSGVIIDLLCEKPFAGVSDSTTIRFKTAGAEPSPPQALNYGSVKLRLDFDRLVKPGTGKMTIITPAGKLKTQIDAKDYSVKIQHNTPF